MKSYNNHVRIEGVVRNIKYDTTLNTVYFDLHRYGDVFKCFGNDQVYSYMRDVIEQGYEIGVSGMFIQITEKDKDNPITEIVALSVDIL